MGVFGVQLVCTMVMTSVLSKVIPYWSPAQWLLCQTGLHYYLHPSDDQLRDKKKPSGKNNKIELNSDGSFDVIPKNIDATLQQAPITENDVQQLRYFPDYQWLVDFTVITLLVYIITEVYLYFNPSHNEVNLSMVWCLLLLVFVIKALLNITLVYFTSSAGDGEKELVVLALFSYLLLAMMLLIVSEKKLELGLDEAYTALNASATEFLLTQDISSVGIINKMSCKGVVAVMAAIFGACLVFPGLRLGKMHWDAVKLYESRRALQLLLHLSFISPAAVSLLWVRPLARHYLVQHTWPTYDRPLMSADSFDVVRIVCVVVVCLLRLLVLPIYLQVYLNMARTRLEEQRAHAGKTTNKIVQKQVASVFYYLCVVTLQCLLPLMLTLVLAVMMKTLGGLEWAALGDVRGYVSAECGLDQDQPARATPPASMAFSRLSAATETTQAISAGLDTFSKVLGPEVWRGLLGFWLWWSTSIWFLSGLFGLLYQRFFTTA